MNILFVHYLEKVGGGERYLLNLLSNINLDKKMLLTPTINNDLDSSLDKSLERIHISFIRNIGPFPSFSLSLFNKVRKLIKEEKIDIIHINDHYLLPTFIPIKYIFNIKIVFTSHGKWDTHFLINRLILKLLNPIVLCATEMNYNRFEKIVDKKYLLPFFTNKQEYQKRILKDKIRLGIVGRFSPIKNHSLGFNILKELGQDYELHLFGDTTLDIKEESNEYREKILNFIREEKNIVHHGIVGDIRNIYDKFDILLVTSISESFSMASIEALSFGIPIISTQTEGSSIIVEEGLNGLLAKDKNDFIEKINIIYNNYEEFSTRAKISSSKFETKEYIKKLEKIYEN